jgi:hypothetical protein
MHTNICRNDCIHAIKGILLGKDGLGELWLYRCAVVNDRIIGSDAVIHEVGCATYSKTEGVKTSTDLLAEAQDLIQKLDKVIEEKGLPGHQPVSATTTTTAPSLTQKDQNLREAMEAKFAVPATPPTGTAEPGVTTPITPTVPQTPPVPPHSPLSNTEPQTAPAGGAGAAGAAETPPKKRRGRKPKSVVESGVVAQKPSPSPPPSTDPEPVQLTGLDKYMV